MPFLLSGNFGRGGRSLREGGYGENLGGLLWTFCPSPGLPPYRNATMPYWKRCYMPAACTLYKREKRHPSLLLAGVGAPLHGGMGKGEAVDAWDG